MLVLKSTEYTLQGYDAERKLWNFVRTGAKGKALAREYLLVSDAKFVEKSTNCVYRLREDGTREALTINGVRQFA